MGRPEFVALQVSILIRSDETKSLDVQAYMETTEFAGEMQEEIATLVQNSLRQARVPFDEVIIALDRRPERARPVDVTPPKKPSGLGRLFGKK